MTIRDGFARWMVSHLSRLDLSDDRAKMQALADSELARTTNMLYALETSAPREWNKFIQWTTWGGYEWADRVEAFRIWRELHGYTSQVI